MRALSPPKSVPKVEQQESRDEDIDPVGGVEHVAGDKVEKAPICGAEDMSEKDGSSPIAAKGSSFLIDDILCQGRKVNKNTKLVIIVISYYWLNFEMSSGKVMQNIFDLTRQRNKTAVRLMRKKYILDCH